MNIEAQKAEKQLTYTFENWLQEYKPIIDWHEFRLNIYAHGYDFFGLCNNEYLFTPELPKYFIEYLLRYGNSKQKKNGTIKIKINENELGIIYMNFKFWVKRVSKLDVALANLD